MFTGIIEETGTIDGVNDTEGGRRLRIDCGFDGLTPGQSVSVDGACLTVERVLDGGFEVFLAEETVSRTAFDEAEAGTVVNLERAMAADGRFDGHIVQGHVDATAEITRLERLGEDWELVVSLPEAIEQYVVEKGSIAVDGISLTVAERRGEAFSVAIIPTTYEETSLGSRTAGDRVHLEVDVIAKYAERIIDESGLSAD